MKAGEERLKEHRNQIVRSPERVQKEIRSLGEATQRQKVEFAEREEAARAFNTKIEHLKMLETVSVAFIKTWSCDLNLVRIGKPCGTGNAQARSCRSTKTQIGE